MSYYLAQYAGQGVISNRLCLSVTLSANKRYYFKHLLNTLSHKQTIFYIHGFMLTHKTNYYGAPSVVREYKQRSTFRIFSVSVRETLNSAKDVLWLVTNKSFLSILHLFVSLFLWLLSVLLLFFYTDTQSYEVGPPGAFTHAYTDTPPIQVQIIQ